MSPRKRVLLAITAGLILLPTLLLSACHTPEGNARAKLDQLLDSTPDDTSPKSPPPGGSQQEAPDDLFQGLPDFPNLNGMGFPGIAMPQSAVDVEETTNAYVLHIPLAGSGDADRVQLQVNPHRIEVSGQTGSQDNGASVSSSFMQSFSTSQEVLPGKVSRQVTHKGKQSELTVTIPKKSPGTPSTAPSSKAEENAIPNAEEAPALEDHSGPVI